MLEAIVLGLVQGLTEFLPVSSSGHLVVVPYLLSMDQPSLAFGVALHFGTLLAVVTYFRGDLWYLATRSLGIGATDAAQPAHARRTVGLLAVGSVPAAVVGLGFESTFEEVFGSPRIVAGFLLSTAAILWLAEHIRRRRVAAALAVTPRALTAEQGRRDPGRDEGTTTFVDGVLIGAAQALSIFPGISRSGATMAAGMLCGLSRHGAARFSFLLSIPVILGASALQVNELFGAPGRSDPYSNAEILLGVLVAAASGYWAIRYLLRLVVTDDLLGFARYVALFGVLVFVGSLWLTPPTWLPF